MVENTKSEKEYWPKMQNNTLILWIWGSESRNKHVFHGDMRSTRISSGILELFLIWTEIPCQFCQMAEVAEEKSCFVVGEKLQETKKHEIFADAEKRCLV